MFRILTVVVIAVGLANTDLSAQEPGPVNRSEVIDGGASIIIASSQSGKTLYGYSIHTGTWDGVAVNNPEKSHMESAVVGSGIAYVTVGKRIYAFSAATGRWAVVELPEIATPRMSVGDRLRIDSGTKIYMFSGVTGKWAIVDLATDKQ